MKRNIKPLLMGICNFLLVTSLFGVTISAETITITGTVNTDYEIVADNGQVYEVIKNLKGEEVVELIDRKVRVTGSVTEEGGVKKIRVDSYEVIDELKKKHSTKHIDSFSFKIETHVLWASILYWKCGLEKHFKIIKRQNHMEVFEQ